MNSKIFKDLYKNLNQAQKKAVDTVEGPVMVIAGPGTGKTQILTLRIANILLETDTSPENILALTFTNAGVHSMRKRLSEIIGVEAYKINIATFHSFCEEIIKNYPQHFQNNLSSKIASDIDQLKILEKIIEDSELKKLKPWGDTFYWVKFLPRPISELKKEAVDPDKFDEMVLKQENDFKQIEDLYHTKGRFAGKMKGEYKKTEEAIEKNRELAFIYRKYQEKLKEKKLYDYDDIILEVIKALEKDENLLLDLQEKYQYILVDEHQDTNNAQNKILELLAGFFDRPNLFIVGDEKQAIYRFQGASLDNFLYFKDKYKDVVLISLEDNYRSTQSILDSAHNLIINNKIEDQELKKKLRSSKKDEGLKVSVLPFSKSQYEFSYLTEDIKKRIGNGEDPSDIAILYRENKDLSDITRALEKTDIPFVIESKQDILSDNDIKKIILLLRVVNDLGNDVLLAEALHIDFLDIDSLDIYKIVELAKKKNISLSDCIKSKELLEEMEILAIDNIVGFYQKLESWKKSSLNEELDVFFERVVRESGFLDVIISSLGSAERLNKLRTIFDEIKKLVENDRDFRLADFIKHLEILKDYNLSIKTKPESVAKGVRLMTAHGAKGLEFDVVYILNAVDKHWGNKRKVNHFHLPITPSIQDNEDERRLFYVAITRAKKEVVITYSLEKVDGGLQAPSQFLTEIGPDLINEIKTENMEKKYSEEKFNIFDPKINFGPSIKDREYLNKLFLEQGLNATALNNYIKCPWRYFYNNLIRIPTAYNKQMMYGNVIHSVLEDVFEKVRREEKVSEDDVIKIFKNNLEKSALSGNDIKEAEEKGVIALLGYYKTYNKEWSKNILNEFKVNGVFLEIDKDTKIILKGKLDKIEILEDNKVNVVDYKTGEPKTRGFVEGTTQDSNGDYKRQLVFYKMLLDKYADKKYNMISGLIDFIEPDKKTGKYKRESFEISSYEAKALEKEVSDISKEILDLSFWERRCEDEKCEYCKMREMMSV